MKLSLISIYLLLTSLILKSQNTQDLENTEIYGDLSKYLSWPMSATAFSGDDLRMLNRFDDRQLAIRALSRERGGALWPASLASLRSGSPGFPVPALCSEADARSWWQTKY